MMRRSIAVISLFLGGYFQSSAQLDSANLGAKIQDDDIPTLPTPHKLFTEPAIEEPETVLPSFEYDVPQFVYDIDPLYTPAEAIKIKPGAQEDLFGNYFKLGFGNYMTPFGEVYLNNLRNKNYNFGGYAKHFSSSNGKPDNANFSENQLGIYGTKFGSKGQLSGRLDYRRDVIHYYGYDHDIDSLSEIQERDINQIYNLFSGNTEFAYKPKRNLRELTFGLDFYRFTNLGSIENNFDGYNRTKFKVGKGIGGLDLNLNFTNLARDTNTLNRFYITGRPFFQFELADWNLDLGLRIIFFGDSSGTKPYVFPDVSVNRFIVKEKLKFYAELDGDVNPNRLNDLVKMNPFVTANPQIQNTVMPLNISAGLKGIVMKKLDFLLQVKNTLYNDFGFFVSDSTVTRNFNVLYSDLNVLSLRSDLSFNHNEKLFVGFGGEFFSYSNTDEIEAWQLPTFKIQANASYTFAKKLNIRLQSYFYGQRFQREIEGNTVKAVELSPIADINVLVQYHYKKNISFFVNLHNVTNSRYQLWYNYPVYGLNVLGGVSFSL